MGNNTTLTKDKRKKLINTFFNIIADHNLIFRYYYSQILANKTLIGN